MSTMCSAFIRPYQHYAPLEVTMSTMCRAFIPPYLFLQSSYAPLEVTLSTDVQCTLLNSPLLSAASWHALILACMGKKCMTITCMT